MEKLGGAVDKVSSVLIPIAAEAFTILIDVFTEVWGAVEPIVTALVAELTPAFKTVIAFTQGTVIPVLKTIASVYFPLVGTAISVLIGAVKIFVSAVSTYFNAVGAVIGAVVRTAVGIIQNLQRGIQNAAGVIKTAIGIVGTVFDNLGKGIATVINGIKSAVNGVVSFFSGLGSRIASATRGMWDGIFKAFKSVINMVIRGWNSIKFTLPKVDIPFVGTFGGFTVGTPDIPYLHSGGIVPGRRGDNVPAILQAGERVVPMSKARESTPGITINIESFIGSDRDIDRFADRVAMRLRIA
jgi:phage-related protein